jgi:hypothetical protein
VEGQSEIDKVLLLIRVQSSAFEPALINLPHTRTTVPDLRLLAAVASRKAAIHSPSVTKRAELLE